MNLPTTPHSRTLAAAAVVAPVLLLTSTVAAIAGNGLGNDAAGGAIQVYAGVAFALAACGLTGRLAPIVPRLAAVLAVACTLGVAGMIGFGHDGIVFSYAPAQALSESSTAAGGIGLFLPGILFPLSFAGLGVVVARTRIAPPWSGVLLALGGVLFPVSRIGEIAALALAVDLLICAGMVPMGVASLRGALAFRATPVPHPGAAAT